MTGNRKETASTNKGFATVLFVTLAPVVLSLLFLFYLFCQLIVIQQQAQHICRSQLLQAQNSMIFPLEQLMRLNPKAIRLIKKRKTALAMMATAAATQNYVLAARARQVLQSALQAQSRLATLQQTLIAQAAMSARAQVAILSIENATIANNHSRFQFIKIHSNQNAAPFFRLAVRKTLPTEKASPYELEQPFAIRQMASSSWSLRFGLPFYTKISRHASGIHRLEGECAATLVQQNNKRWKAVLREGRSW